ncbi:MAG: glycosyltransferase, partial [Pseudomonadota bacterium]
MPAPSLVSVLIRTFNRPQLLLEAVNSVLQQTWSNLEIIIVNDNGDDHSASLPASSIDPVRTLRWFNISGEPGRSAAANLALEKATGEYCLFLDDDDWLDPPHIANLVAAIHSMPAALLVYSAVKTYRQDTGETKESFNHPFDATRLLAENYIPIHAALFSRELIRLGCRFDTALDRYEDWDFWLQVLQHTNFLFVPECTATYRIAAQSGFGEKTDEALQDLRLDLYRKWLPRWSNQQILAMMDRCRQFPQIAVLQNEFEEQGKYLRHMIKFEKELHVELQSRTGQLVDTRRILKETQDSLANAMLDLQIQQDTVRYLRADLDLIYKSRSWKITRPLRMVSKVRTMVQIEGVGSVARRIHAKLFRKPPQMPVVTSAFPMPGEYHELEFPQFDKPLISIVIPVYGKFEYTFHCLKSVLANSSEQSYEVIVVDDCSKDDTLEQLAKIKGITVIRNETNGGFIFSCNAGAKAARGEYIMMLNNDTEPQPLWLTALVNTFRDFPDVGMVGAKLLYPDGTLQEAGGIVWRDGSAWNFGRNDDPNKPEYSWCRQVDYCSGACLLIKREDYFALGMFDKRYTPAYYEDTDLAFQVRAAGKKMYYQPLARVIHFEGVSCGTDATGGIKDYQRTNHKKFFARWEETLLKHRLPGLMPELEKERNVEKRVFVVDARVLMPDHDSGSLRMFNLLKIFQRLGYKVTFAPDNLQYDEKYTPLLQGLGIECIYFPYQQSIPEYLQQFGSMFQVVLLSRADFAEKYIDAVKLSCPHAQVLFDTVDLHFLRERREAELNNDKGLMESADMRKLQELHTARKAHQTLIVSPVEIELFKKEAPDVKVALLSNIHAAEGRGAEYKDRSDILFIGSFEHPPNIDAMFWFIDEVFPLLHQQKPDLKLRIVGGSAPRKLTAKGTSHIIFEGFVDDITPIFNSV